MPKPKKQVAKKNDGSNEEEEYKGDAELEGELDGDAVIDAITTDSDDFDANEALGIDKDMDSFDDHETY